MYRLDPLPDGSTQRVPVVEWTQDLKDVPQIMREQMVGWGYQPHFHWGDADVLGREVEFVLWYEDPTGRRVGATPKILRVPSYR